MGQILNYDTVINARASGQYYDIFLFASHILDSAGWTWQNTTVRVDANAGWCAASENRFSNGQSFSHSFAGMATLAAGGLLFSADNSFGAPLPPVQAPTLGRQRWITYAESTLLNPPGLQYADLLWAAKHDMGTLTATGSSPTLRRYADGNGVKIVAYISSSALTRVPETILTVTYTNQDGVTGRTAVGRFKTLAPIGSCASSSFYSGDNVRVHMQPFIDLQQGDTGVRAITGWTLDGTNVSKNMIVALVRPLFTMPLAVGASFRSIDLLARPEGPVEMVVGSDGKHGAIFTLFGTPTASALGIGGGTTRIATVEV